MSEVEQLNKNIKKLMFIYSLNKSEMRKLFDNNMFYIVENPTHKKYKLVLKALTEYFNISLDTLLYKDIINTDLNRRYFL